MKRTFRVIDKQTGKEADLKLIAQEDWVQKSLCWTDLDGFVVDNFGDLYLLDECGSFVLCDSNRFEVVWDV